MDQKKLRRLLDFQIHLWELKQIELARDSEHTAAAANELLRGKLWIGSSAAAADIKFDAIVSVGNDEESYVTLPNVEYFRIVAKDDPKTNLKRWFDDVGKFIHFHIAQCEHRVLVHCSAGASRSATLCIAYLIKYMFLDFYAAYMVVKSARPRILPNIGFIQQLLEYERELK